MRGVPSGRLPLAADGRDDGVLGLELLECLVDLLPVDAGDLLDLAGTERLARLFHRFQNFILNGYDITVMESDSRYK